MTVNYNAWHIKRSIHGAIISDWNIFPVPTDFAPPQAALCPCENTEVLTTVT